MTYQERFDEIQKIIDAKSTKLASMDIGIFTQKDYKLISKYEEVKWILKYLIDTQEELMEEMIKNKRSLVDEMVVVAKRN